MEHNSNPFLLIRSPVHILPIKWQSALCGHDVYFYKEQFQTDK